MIHEETLSPPSLFRSKILSLFGIHDKVITRLEVDTDADWTIFNVLHSQNLTLNDLSRCFSSYTCSCSQEMSPHKIALQTTPQVDATHCPITLWDQYPRFPTYQFLKQKVVECADDPNSWPEEKIKNVEDGFNVRKLESGGIGRALAVANEDNTERCIIFMNASKHKAEDTFINNGGITNIVHAFRNFLKDHPQTNLKDFLQQREGHHTLPIPAKPTPISPLISTSNSDTAMVHPLQGVYSGSSPYDDGETTSNTDMEEDDYPFI